MGNEKQKGKAFALLPIGVFLVIFLGAGILFKDFYAMPAVVAFLIALFVAFLQNRKVSFQKKMEVIAKGLGEENIITMCLIFLCAGAFSCADERDCDDTCGSQGHMVPISGNGSDGSIFVFVPRNTDYR